MLYVYMYEYVYVCMYMHVSICIYMYMYMCMYICSIHLMWWLQRQKRLVCM